MKKIHSSFLFVIALFVSHMIWQDFATFAIYQLCFKALFLKIGIHSMQGWTATTSI